jgi:hypothetical protein
MNQWDKYHLFGESNELAPYPYQVMMLYCQNNQSFQQDKSGLQDKRDSDFGTGARSRYGT